MVIMPLSQIKREKDNAGKEAVFLSVPLLSMKKE
ncbi:hypothetical protein ZMO1_ZMO1383 [Zymomonas mobilis subsp. mobilis ZM4 = ATCC 31821]|uniref:Uncharacterized protein n=1 Tax=Zymomonas mobilis subsp. mobilis (strain ATCC 31821 / ZM4 / CP4) TaxID=264203 RepID=Q5NMQ3_ZYMMO|nr:hypothetical protein ZMO1383 [Zymomonas mobilis subsp. mobilis ZM4 = ATCC 31821]AVZ26236.1 hypothetical protein ZMO2_ZMO1383 [Zymomonas mobilis subsp. mobilis]AVZ28123.1 hypothetical protein ZMO3_ZMO1383 [Zymomonas mobilis subsp. mobilis]AVZ42568.1 hypothetical protein ZMO1_ZMO1383 [Zymomonas mobilis subsp. mobilis ZM4 = ATCC 31821]